MPQQPAQQTTGTGPGAGGSGTGRGGGGSGGGGGIGAEARLLGGNSAKLPSRLLRVFAADRGYGHLLLTVAEAGRVTDCSVLQSTGDARVDQALCNLMIRQSRWEPARDRQGNADYGQGSLHRDVDEELEPSLPPL